MKGEASYVKEWIRKALADERAARRASADVRKHKDQAEIACFHAQQAVEKYLKALLVAQGKPVAKVHDLLALAYLLKKEDILLEDFEDDFRLLNAYSVEIRYPGAVASPVDARLAVRKMEKILKRLVLLLR